MPINKNFGLSALNEIEFENINVVKIGTNNDYTKILAQTVTNNNNNRINLMSISNLNLIPYFNNNTKSFDELCSEHKIINIINSITTKQLKELIRYHHKENYVTNKHNKIINKMCDEENINFMQATSLFNIMLDELVHCS